MIIYYHIDSYKFCIYIKFIKIIIALSIQLVHFSKYSLWKLYFRQATFTVRVIETYPILNGIYKNE